METTKGSIYIDSHLDELVDNSSLWPFARVLLQSARPRGSWSQTLELTSNAPRMIRRLGGGPAAAFTLPSRLHFSRLVYGGGGSAGCWVRVLKPVVVHAETSNARRRRARQPSRPYTQSEDEASNRATSEVHRRPWAAILFWRGRIGIASLAAAAPPGTAPARRSMCAVLRLAGRGDAVDVRQPVLVGGACLFRPPTLHSLPAAAAIAGTSKGHPCGQDRWALRRRLYVPFTDTMNLSTTNLSPPTPSRPAIHRSLEYDVPLRRTKRRGLTVLFLRWGCADTTLLVFGETRQREYWFATLGLCY